jgi:hypothetical protein
MRYKFEELRMPISLKWMLVGLAYTVFIMVFLLWLAALSQVHASGYKHNKHKHKRWHNPISDATSLVIRSASKWHVPKLLALKISRHESGTRCGVIGDQGRSHGPMQIQIATARGLFGISHINRLSCAVQTDLGVRHLAMAYKMSHGSWCGAAVKHNGGLGSKGGNYMTRVYANSVIGGCFNVSKTSKRKRHLPVKSKRLNSTPRYLKPKIHSIFY